MFRRKPASVVTLLIAATLLCLGQICNPPDGTNSIVIPVTTIQDKPIVEISTSLGKIVIELFPQQAPMTVQNVLQYVNSGFYTNTIFHEVVPNTSIAAGLYLSSLDAKIVRDPVPNESNNGLRNLRGYVALVEPDGNGTGTGTSMFLINLRDNSSADFNLADKVAGRTVFGRVIEGMSVADAIGALGTGSATAGDGETLSRLPQSKPTITSAVQQGVEPSTPNEPDEPDETNAAPVAKAVGPVDAAAANGTITLDGSESTDPENAALLYAWEQVSGTPVQISNLNTATPTFTAPDRAATLTFKLTVTDPKGATSTDTVSVTVRNPRVRLKTNKGDIVMEMLVAGAPITTDNFMQYVRDKFYDGTIFHRVIGPGPSFPNGFVIQGGGFLPDLTQPEGLRGPIQNEFSPARSNLRATVSMAKLGGDPNSATSQFFISLTDNSSNLDNQNGGFTVFANVIEGMDVVDAIAAVATGTRSDPDGNDFEDVPLEDVVVTTATLE